MTSASNSNSRRYFGCALANGSVILLTCDCKDFWRLHTLDWDDEDAREQKWVSCPYCKKPFHSQNVLADPTAKD